MKNVNTIVSYALRSIVILHIGLIALVLTLLYSNLFSLPRIPDLFISTRVALDLVVLLLIADWATRKDSSRRFSKSIDSFIGIAWILGVCAVVLSSFGMAISLR